MTSCEPLVCTTVQVWVAVQIRLDTVILAAGTVRLKSDNECRKGLCLLCCSQARDPTLCNKSRMGSSLEVVWTLKPEGPT
jgi:hypothetical protein